MKNIKRILYIVLFGAIVIGFVLMMKPKSNVTQEVVKIERTSPTITPSHDSTSAIVEQANSLTSNVHKSKKAYSLDRQRREKLLAEKPDDYFDPTRYLESNDDAYRKKVRRHFDIAAWALSNRKSDPELRQFMALLLENGYGIDDYRKTIQIVADYKQELEAIKIRYKSLGFYSNEEIEELLHQRGAYQRMSAHINGTKPIFERMGITDTKLIEALWDVDVGYITKGDGAIGQGQLQTVWGDKLLTDDDWLEPEFLEAQARYEGQPRGTMEERFKEWEQRRRIEKGRQ